MQSAARGRSPSALPLVVRGLDRAGEGDDVRRERLDEQAVLAPP
jgi:hypothetical protein